MSHTIPCITNVLPDVESCVWPDGDPRMATRGEVCERCYDRIDHAIQIAEHLRALDRTLHGPLNDDKPRLAGDGFARAVTPNPEEATSSFAGPRVPLTALQLDIEAINRVQDGHTDPTNWVATEAGAAQAVRFANYVQAAERAHPTVESERKLGRFRCPDCKRQTATWQPPSWPGEDVRITCIACGWHANNPDALGIITDIESKGPLSDGEALILILAKQKQRKTDRQHKGAA